ncbi:unnamed protein product [Cuscuta campestris]|uniref:Uncharacterized protein n=1 Tax=Cuscuta campestris TaxID=132261 RepID=A0A484KH86_9ASTE|nr:unnamed protein product [Cuscuta campestris]
MYVYGGRSYMTEGIYAGEGCFLGDLHVLDLKNWSWSKLDKDHKRILSRSILGHPGLSLVTRGGHSVNLLGNCLVIFGGEDARWNCPLNDLHVLDLVSRKWSKPLVRGVPPAGRLHHAATVHTARR